VGEGEGAGEGGGGVGGWDLPQSETLGGQQESERVGRVRVQIRIENYTDRETFALHFTHDIYYIYIVILFYYILYYFVCSYTIIFFALRSMPHCWISVAMSCSVLQCAVVWHYAAVCCSVLQCVAVCCSVLQCAVVWHYVEMLSNLSGLFCNIFCSVLSKLSVILYKSALHKQGFLP